MCTVYFLFSNTTNKYYVGITNDLADRLHRHNSAQSTSTKAGIPWILIHKSECVTKAEAMKLEKKIKSRGIARYLNDNNISPYL